MNNSVKIIAGIIITPTHHQALLDEFGELFVEKLFDEKMAFELEKDTYIIGFPVGNDILVHNHIMIGAGTCFEYNMRVNKFVGAIDERLLFTITKADGDARNGIWILPN